MPDYATSSGDPSRGRSARPVVAAGEVTPRKQNGQSTKGTNDRKPPPRFAGKRRFGAKNFLDTELAVAEAAGDQGGYPAHDTDIRNLPSLRLETASSSHASTLVPDEGDTHRLAAPAGWRRFWRVIGTGHDSAFNLTGDSDITISPYCKRCYDSGAAEFCDMTKRGTVTWGREHGGGRCDHCRPADDCCFLITYRHADDVPIDKLPTYKLRNLASQWVAAGDQGLQLPTSLTEFSPYLVPVLPPQPAPAATQEKPAGTATVAAPLARPTYSQTRATYHDLKETATRAPPSERGKGADGLGRPDNRPVWVADMAIGHWSSFEEKVLTRLHVSPTPQPPALTLYLNDPIRPNSDRLTTPDSSDSETGHVRLGLRERRYPGYIETRHPREEEEGTTQMELTSSGEEVAQNGPPTVPAARAGQEGAEKELRRDKLLTQMRRLCGISRAELVTRIQHGAIERRREGSLT